MTIAHEEPRVQRYAGAFFYFVATLALLGIVGGLIYQLHLSSQIKDLTQQIAAVQTVNRANTKLLVECTTPPAERVPPVDNPLEDDCYVRSQQGQSAAIANIKLISIAASACGAKTPGDVKRTRACVDETLAALDR